MEPLRNKPSFFQQHKENLLWAAAIAVFLAIMAVVTVLYG